MMQTEKDIITRVLQGDDSAFSVLVKKYQQPLYRVVLRFVKSEEVAEDVVQEAFIKAFRKLDMYEGRASFRSWLFQIGVNSAKNKLRGTRKDMIALDDVKLSAGAESDENHEYESVQSMIQLEVEKLPEKQRQALELRIFEDLSFKEIAEIMGCPYDTAKANYRHGLLKLKKSLSDSRDLRDWYYAQGGPEVEFAGYQMEVDA
jgi:RNA polymerase sigma-70 factor (ECF subfamily)